MTNLSSIPLDMPLSHSIEISFRELVSDLCRQLDHKILLMVMFIFSFYVFRNFLLWRGYAGFVSFVPEKFHNIFRVGAERLESFLDTASLFSVLFLVYLFYKQSAFTYGYWVWLLILVVIIFFSVLAGVFDFVKSLRGGRHG